MASFGEELKRERELRDISLKEIAEATKVSIRFLEALEQNNFDILPGGIFNRGFIRAYARFIGVDGEEMVNSYLHELSQREGKPASSARAGRATGGAAKPVTPQSAPPTLTAGVFRPEKKQESAARSIQPSAKPSPSMMTEVRRVPFNAEASAAQTPSLALWLLVALGMALGVVIITVSMMGRRPADASADTHAEAVKARLSRLAAERQVQPGAHTNLAPEGATAAAPGGSPLTDPNIPAAGPGAGALAAETAAPASGPPAATQAQSPVSGAGVTEPGPPAIPEHSVRLQAAEATRVELECGGQIVLDQEFWPGQVKIIDCKEPVVLSAANGGAVQYSLDGGPPAFLGAVGQQIDGSVLAPPPAAPAGAAAPAPAGRGSTPHAGR